MDGKENRVERFDSAICRELADEALAAIQAVAERRGLIVEKSGGRYGDDEFVAKFTFRVRAADGAPKSFAADAAAIGLPEDCYGKTFRAHTGEEFKIVGVDPRRRKYPVSTVRVKDGKAFKFTAESVRAALGTL